LTPKVPDTYKEEKRAALLQSALACFAEQGYQTTTIDDIVRHAGVSKGMIYNYFPSKEEIYLQLLQEQTDSVFGELKAQFVRFGSAQEKLRILLMRFREIPLSLNRQRAMAVHLEFTLYCARHEELAQLMVRRYERFISFLSDILEEGKASGEFSKEFDATTFAAVFWALRDGICFHSTHAFRETDYERVCDMAEQILFRFLQP
jgi:AcrR family transcriptional regulator